jgi:hypothetical protein
VFPVRYEPDVINYLKEIKELIIVFSQSKA